MSGSRLFKSRNRARPSRVAGDKTRHIGGFQLCNLALGQREGQCGDGIIDMLGLRGTDDGGGHDRLLRHPSEGNLGFRHAARSSYRGDCTDYLSI